jgi:predicted transcriptional regulator
MSAKRAVVRLQLDLEAKRRLDDLCEKRGMTQIAVISRLVIWFTKQDDLIQTAILGGLRPSDLTALSKLILKRMSRGRLVE